MATQIFEAQSINDQELYSIHGGSSDDLDQYFYERGWWETEEEYASYKEAKRGGGL